jgi:hypothetical protein
MLRHFIGGAIMKPLLVFLLLSTLSFIVPEEVAFAENDEIDPAPSSNNCCSTNKQEDKDSFDMGMGLNIGLLPGPKFRIFGETSCGLALGVDVEVGIFVLTPY